MTPSGAKFMYRRQMAGRGEQAVFKRGATEVSVTASVTGYDAEEMAAGIDMAARRVIVMYEDLVNAGFPVPLRKGDQVVAIGRLLRFEEIEPRRVQGVTIAYEGMALG